MNKFGHMPIRKDIISDEKSNWELGLIMQVKGLIWIASTESGTLCGCDPDWEG